MSQKILDVAKAIEEREQKIRNIKNYHDVKSNKWVDAVDELFRNICLWLAPLSEKNHLRTSIHAITITEKIPALHVSYKTCELHLDLINIGTVIFKPAECITQPPGMAKISITGLYEQHYLQWRDVGNDSNWDLVNDVTSLIHNFDSDSLGDLLKKYVETPFI